MAIGDIEPVDPYPGGHYVDTGMFDAPEYGSVYLVEAERPFLVDSGIGADRDAVFDAIDELGLAPEAVLLTHVHLDHAGGAGYLVDRHDVTVYVHEAGARHLVDPDRLVAGTREAVGDQWRHYADPKPIPESNVEPLSPGDRLGLGDHTFDVRPAPGHAAHQVVYHDAAADTVFTGDAAGIYVPSLDRVVETSPPPEFDLEACLDDVDAIRDRDPKTLCYGHFGPAPADDRLDAFAERLRGWVTEAERAITDAPDRATAVDRLFDRRETDRVWGPDRARAEVDLNLRGVATYRDLSF